MLGSFMSTVLTMSWSRSLTPSSWVTVSPRMWVSEIKIKGSKCSYINVSESGNKVVEKDWPEEAVGVVCKLEGKIQVIRYVNFSSNL